MPNFTEINKKNVMFNSDDGLFTVRLEFVNNELKEVFIGKNDSSYALFMDSDKLIDLRDTINAAINYMYKKDVFELS